MQPTGFLHEDFIWFLCLNIVVLPVEHEEAYKCFPGILMAVRYMKEVVSYFAKYHLNTLYWQFKIIWATEWLSGPLTKHDCMMV